MVNRLFEIYDMLISGIDSERAVERAVSDSYWSFVSSGENCGIAMTTDGLSRSPIFESGLVGLPLKDAALASKSWNLEEASFGCAAVNSFYNTLERLERLGAYRPFENHYSEELDFSGKTVGIIGHLKETVKRAEASAARYYVLERNPKPGDYPDSACDYILPECDIVVITGSSLVNKTLPHILELCPKAYKVLTGPSVPMCTGLLDMGLNMIAGMVISDVPGILNGIDEGDSSSPYKYGVPFMIRR